MPIVDLIFDWGNTIILYFSKAADWFCSPNQVFDEAVGVLVELPVFGHLFEFLGLQNLVGLSPIEFIIGPGLLFFLALKFASFVKNVIQAVFTPGLGV